jgi:hypothetical protein
MTAVATASRAAANTGGGSAVSRASRVPDQVVPPSELTPATIANETTIAKP